jgi:hypothetical protein
MSERWIPEDGFWDEFNFEKEEKRKKAENEAKKAEDLNNKFAWWWLIFLISFSLIGGIYIFVKENI